MMQKILIGMLLVFGLCLFSPMSAMAVTDPFKQACDLPDTSTSEACRPGMFKDPIGGPDGILMKVSVAISGVAGAVAVIIIVVGGMQFVFSGGDSAKAAKARSAIIYALIGIVVIAVAQSIIVIVINAL